MIFGSAVVILLGLAAGYLFLAMIGSEALAVVCGAIIFAVLASVIYDVWSRQKSIEEKLDALLNEKKDTHEQE